MCGDPGELLMLVAYLVVGIGACLPSLTVAIVGEITGHPDSFLIGFVSIYPIFYGISKIPEGVWLNRCLKCCGFMGCLEFYTAVLIKMGVRNPYILVVLTILLSLASVVLWLRWYRKSEYYAG